ncbi:MAG: nucleotidyltransferase domain-containing protein [Halothiobacillaceae bacterium]
MDERLRKVLDELKTGLAELYGDRLKGVYLFGSCARDEAGEESDIDVLIVLDEVDNYSGEIARTSELIARLSLGCGRSISRVFVSEQRWREDRTMFILNVREEAVPA